MVEIWKGGGRDREEGIFKKTDKTTAQHRM